MTELSPDARAVLDAAAEAMECPDNFLPYERDLMAAALRAAANQVVPATQKSVNDSLAELVELGDDPLSEAEVAVLRLSVALGLERNHLIRSQLLSIATELESMAPDFCAPAPFSPAETRSGRNFDG